MVVHRNDVVTHVPIAGQGYESFKLIMRVRYAQRSDTLKTRLAFTQPNFAIVP